MKKIILPFFAAVSMLPGVANAGVPLSFTHQGLLKEDGNLVNGEREITAIIMDENDSEVARTSSKVPVDSGSYIMTITGIDSDKVAAAQKLKLWVQVEGELLTPALTINSVPYAVVANRAESVNTSGGNLAGQYGYRRDGDVQNNLTVEAGDICPCDTNPNDWNCGDAFTDAVYNRAGCYDVYGAAYQYYVQQDEILPVETTVVKAAGIGIGTAQPEAPLHIRANQGEARAEVVVADSQPEIRLEDLTGQGVSLLATADSLAVAFDQSTPIVVSTDSLAIAGKVNVVGDTTITGNANVSGTLSAAQLGPDTKLPENMFAARGWCQVKYKCKNSSGSSCYQQENNGSYCKGLTVGSFSNTTVIINGSSYSNSVSLSFTFNKPLDNADYVVVPAYNGNQYASWPLVVQNQTKNGFNVISSASGINSSQAGYSIQPVSISVVVFGD